MQESTDKQRGVSNTEVGDLTYGGTASDDSSGSIRYLRVEYTGATFTNEKEFNGFLYLVLVLELPLSMLRPTKQGMMASNSLVEQLMANIL